jgi:hypothetical protein
MPRRLATDHPDEITILDHKAFFWPLWTPDHLKWMFASTRDLDASNAFAHHLWESRAWLAYLENLTVAEVRSRDTNFHRLVRPLIAERPNEFGAVSWRARAGTQGRRALQKARELKSSVTSAVKNSLKAKGSANPLGESQ